GSMNNDGSINNSWSTLDSVMLQKANLFVGGDTLFLGSGYHGNRVLISNNPTSSITIIAQKNNAPLLLNFIIDGSNWVLDGLTFTQEGNTGTGNVSSFSNGMHLSFGKNSKKNIVQNCKFYSIEDASSWVLLDWRNNVWSGIIDFGQNNVIRNNHLFNIAFAIQLTEECDSAIVEKNIIENFSGDGIRIGGADFCRIESNIVKNSIELDANTHDGNHEDGIQAWDFDDGVNGLIVRGNFVLNYEKLDQPFRGLMQGMGFFDGFYNNCIIENNVIVVEHWHGISLYGAKDTRIVNNTVLPNPGGSKIAGPPWIGIFPHKDGRKSTGNVIRNNLTTATNLAGSGSINDHNVVDANANAFCSDYDNYNFYPKFNFTLNGKTLLDVGSQELAPSFDFNGTLRPQGSGYDIGAYEITDSTTNISSKEVNKNQFYLLQNYPNPFNPSTKISYTLPKTSEVKISIYNSLGQRIKILVNQNQIVGSYSVDWDGTDNLGNDVSSGIYFYNLLSGDYVQTRKMLLLK
ncbi:MAG: FlgD immunoglobulin-like domain containing protein, partial [Saprospiraceae bacterium]